MQEHIHRVLETMRTVAASRETLAFDIVPPFLLTITERNSAKVIPIPKNDET